MKTKMLAWAIAVILLVVAAAFSGLPYARMMAAADSRLDLWRLLASRGIDSAEPAVQHAYEAALLRFRPKPAADVAAPTKDTVLASLATAASCQATGLHLLAASKAAVPPAILGLRNGCATKPASPLLAAKPLPAATPLRVTAAPKPAVLTASTVGPSAASATPPAPIVRLPAPATVRPLASDACSGMSLNIVAHQDDDLLFMNPDIFNDIKAGRCIRTVYLTAGDAGENQMYWQDREHGSEAAYAEMLGQPDEWSTQRQMLDGVFVTAASLDAAPGVSLLFIRLPDGNIWGSGFAATHQESLQMLLSGVVPAIHTVDTQTAISKQQLVDMLHLLITTDSPTVIRTQGSDNLEDGDHSDHHAAGQLTKLAAEGSVLTAPIQYYLGYPDKLQPTNLSADDVLVKQQAFLAYAQHDSAVCQTVIDCQQSYVYGHYLERQYIVGSGTSPPTQALASVALP